MHICKCSHHNASSTTQAHMEELTDALADLLRALDTVDTVAWGEARKRARAVLARAREVQHGVALMALLQFGRVR